MAVVERVEAQLVADATQFVAGINRATQTLGQLNPALQRINGELTRVTQQFAAGRISGQQLGTALVRIHQQSTTATQALAAIEQRTEALNAALIEGKITVQQYARQMELMRAAMGPAGLAGTVGKTMTGFKRFENTMTSIAISSMPAMSGATGRLANAVTGLGLAFAGLGPVILPILGALALFAIALEKAKAKSEALFKSLQVDRERRQRELTVIMGVEDVNLLRRRLAENQRVIDEFERQRSSSVLGQLGAAGPEPAGIQQTRARVNALAGRLRDLEQAASGLAAQKEDLDQFNRTMDDMARRGGQIARTMGAAADAASRLAVQAKAIEPFVLGMDLPRVGPGGVSGTENVVQEVNDILANNPIAGEAQMAFEKQMAEAGYQAATALVNGMFDGFQNMEDILKAFIASFIQAAILGPLFGKLKIFSPSRVTMDMGHQLGAGLVLGMNQMRATVQAAALDMAPVGALQAGGAMATRELGNLALQANFNMSGMPAAMTPFAAARDAEWQRLFRETSLVADASGFRRR